MSIQIVSKEESFLLRIYRSITLPARKKMIEDMEKLIEAEEDKEDLKELKKRRKEKGIPAAEVWEKLGI